MILNWVREFKTRPRLRTEQMKVLPTRKHTHKRGGICKNKKWASIESAEYAAQFGGLTHVLNNVSKFCNEF